MGGGRDGGRGEGGRDGGDREIENELVSLRLNSRPVSISACRQQTNSAQPSMECSAYHLQSRHLEHILSRLPLLGVNWPLCLSTQTGHSFSLSWMTSTEFKKEKTFCYQNNGIEILTSVHLQVT